MLTLGLFLMEHNRKRIVVLDTHAILHRAYHALPDFSSSKGEPTGALFGLVSILIKIFTDLQPDYVVAAFDLPDPTHRHVAFEDYKAQRKETDDALVAQIVRSRDVLAALGIPCYACPGFEADDIIGTIARHTKEGDEVDLVIASGDMDMLQLVDDGRVRVFTFKKGVSETILYDEDAVRERYGFGPTQIADYKGLRGDPSDNIPGVKGVGEKTATMLLASFGSVEGLYAAIAKDPASVRAAGISEKMLLSLETQEESARFSKELAIIRTDAPINFTLPTRPWSESVDAERVLEMMREFDFRSLLPRMQALLKSTGRVAHTETLFEEVRVEPTQEEVSKEDMYKAALAVWVLDSSSTEPTLEDVYRVGKNRTFAKAYEALCAEVDAQGLSFVYEQIELPLMPVLRAMEKRGVRVDRDFLEKLSTQYHKELDLLAGRIYAAAGKEFNINSPKQLGDVLFETLGLTARNQKKTAGGQRSTRESELEKLRDQSPIVADVLAYRELQKLLSTYIDTIPTLLDGEDRLHTSYVQTGTSTGRLSSQNPNLQNIPVKTELGRAIRQAFVPSPGMQLVSFDYSQIELRIAAALSGDAALTEIFMAGRDVHTEVATRVFHVSAQEVMYEQRRRAKIINFGILYGMGVNSLRESLGTPRAEAQEFYNQYFEAFPGLAAYLEKTKADAARLGYTETLFGRKRYFAGISSPIPYVRASAERMAINAPIQGTQADVVKIAMIAIEAWVEESGLQDRVRMLLQVHDELIFEIADSVVGQVSPHIKALMEGALPSEKRRHIPFTVEGKSGSSWGDMQPLAI